MSSGDKRDTPEFAFKNATLEQKAAAFEWLRGQALKEGNPHWFHAAVAMEELNRLARPSSAPSVDIERVKAWFYSKPRKQAQAAFTAGDERQIAYMLEDAEAKAVVAMNAAAQSAKAPTHFFKLPLTIFDGKKGEMLRIVVDGDGRTVPLENVLASINLGAVDAGNPAARTEEVPHPDTARLDWVLNHTPTADYIEMRMWDGEGDYLKSAREGIDKRLSGPSNTPEKR